MATSTYKKFQRAVGYLSRTQGYDTGRLLALADRYGYKAFANLAPDSGQSHRGAGSNSGQGGDAGGLGRSPGTNTPVQVMAPAEPAQIGPAETNQTMEALASGGQLAAGVATGNPQVAIGGAIGTAKGLLGFGNKPDLDTSPVHKVEVGPELKLEPKLAKSEPQPDSKAPATIDEWVTITVDYLKLGPVFEKLLRCYGHWERGTSKGWVHQQVPKKTREGLWASMQDIAYQSCKAHPSVCQLFIVFSGLVEMSSDASCEHNGKEGHGCVWRGLFGPIVRAVDDAHTNGPIEKDPGRYRTVAKDAAMWAVNRVGRQDPKTGDYVESGDWVGARIGLVRNLATRTEHRGAGQPGWVFEFETDGPPDMAKGKLHDTAINETPLDEAPPPMWGASLAGDLGQHVQNKLTKSVRQLSEALVQLGL